MNIHHSLPVCHLQCRVWIHCTSKSWKSEIVAVMQSNSLPSFTASALVPLERGHYPPSLPSPQCLHPVLPAVQLQRKCLKGLMKWILDNTYWKKRNPRLLCFCCWSETWEHSREKEAASSTSQLQTSLGENSPTVSINTGWGILGLSEGFGVNKQAFRWMIESVSIGLRRRGDASCLFTFLGENTPTVPPSSRIATPISASKASLWTEAGLGHPSGCRSSLISAASQNNAVYLLHTRKVVQTTPPFLKCSINSTDLRSRGKSKHAFLWTCSI